MKFLVIGGTGLIGSKLVAHLTSLNHTAIAASPSKGINSVTGQGLEEAMKGVDIVIDVTNSPAWEDKAVMEFFEKSGKNIAEAEKKAGVKHHLVLSIVGTEKLVQSGYFRAKEVQEKLAKESGIPYTIVQATQFYEFLDFIVNGCAVGDTVKLTTGFIQPIAADDVVQALTKFALEPPRNGAVEIAGPEKYRMPEIISKYMADIGDKRKAVGDPETNYFGVDVHDVYLVPAFPDPWLGPTNYATWFAASKYAKK